MHAHDDDDLPPGVSREEYALLREFLDRFDVNNSDDRYILNEKGEPELCPDLLKWAMWMQKSKGQRHIAQDFDEGETDPAKKVHVSTVFLGLDHGYGRIFGGKGPPVLWETMVFGGILDGEQVRYASREAAFKGHQDMCRRVGETIQRKKEE